MDITAVEDVSLQRLRIFVTVVDAAEATVLPDAAAAVDASAEIVDATPAIEPVVDVAAEPPIVEAQVEDAAAAAEPAGPARKRGARKTAGRRPAAAKSKEPRAEKAAKPRARKTTRARAAEAADHVQVRVQRSS